MEEDWGVEPLPAFTDTSAFKAAPAPCRKTFHATSQPYKIQAMVSMDLVLSAQTWPSLRLGLISYSQPTLTKGTDVFAVDLFTRVFSAPLQGGSRWFHLKSGDPSVCNLARVGITYLVLKIFLNSASALKIRTRFLVVPSRNTIADVFDSRAFS